jgi:hypothetical protein
LNQTVDDETIDLWKQGWLSVDQLGIDVYFVEVWNKYILELRNGHIRLKEDQDEFTWNKNKSARYYLAKLSYEVLSSIDDQEESWWWPNIWKVRAPKKTKVFMWLLLMNMVPTWDLLQKKRKQCPDICILCRNSMKMYHTCLLSVIFP